MNTYGAMPLWRPQEGVHPLQIVESRGKFQKISSLRHLLEGDEPVEVDFRESDLPDLSGKRSLGVKFNLGLKVLENFLASFKLPSSEIVGKLENVSTLAFSFKNVKQIAVDPFELGKALADRRVDQHHPSASIYLGFSSEPLHVIDSVITSPSFELTFGDSSIAELRLELPTLQGIVGRANAGVNVEEMDERTLSFQGSKALTFAFTVVTFYIDDDRRFYTRKYVLENAFDKIADLRISRLMTEVSDEAQGVGSDLPIPEIRISNDMVDVSSEESESIKVKELPKVVLGREEPPERTRLTPSPRFIQWDVMELD
jgi:hypothetical protein